MIVRDRRIRGLGSIRMGQAESSHVHVRAIDKEGRPMSGIPVRVTTPSGVTLPAVQTNGNGWAIISMGVPDGTPVRLAVDLPEGTAGRTVNTVLHASGQVELFQSVEILPQSLVTAAEAVGFGLGLVLAVAGLHIKDRGAQEVVVGLGSGVFAVSGFSLIFRHLR